MTEQRKGEHIFPKVKRDYSKYPFDWQAGWSEGTYQQRDADVKALNERLDRGEIARWFYRFLYGSYYWSDEYTKQKWEFAKSKDKKYCLVKADQIIKLIREG